MQQIELVAVQRLFHRVDDDIHVVLGKMLGNLVPGSNTPSVTLLQVGRSPRCIKVMDGDASFLRIHARSEHTCGAEQHSHCPCVHGIYHRLTSLIRLTLLNEAHLTCRYAVILHQLAFYLAVHVPSFPRLICPQVGEHELRTLVRLVLVVILCNHLGTMACLVVGMVLVVRVYHAHIKSHLSRVVGGDEHLRLFLRFRQG